LVSLGCLPSVRVASPRCPTARVLVPPPVLLLLVLVLVLVGLRMRSVRVSARRWSMLRPSAGVAAAWAAWSTLRYMRVASAAGR